MPNSSLLLKRNNFSDTFKIYANNLTKTGFSNMDLDLEGGDEYLQLLIYCQNLKHRIYANTSNLLKNTLIKYIYPILFLLGIVGNILCLSVIINSIKKKSKFNKNFSLCLATLCFTDMTIIIFCCLREYIEAILEISVRSTSIHSCRFFFFVCYLFSSYSSYLYAFIAWERWHAISYPIEHKQNRANRNKKTIFKILVYCFLISLPFLYFPTLNETIKEDKNDILKVKLEKSCEITNTGNILLTLLDFIFFCFIPFLISILFSILTLLQLIRRNRIEKCKSKEMMMPSLKKFKNDSNSSRTMLPQVTEFYYKTKNKNSKNKNQTVTQQNTRMEIQSKYPSSKRASETTRHNIIMNVEQLNRMSICNVKNCSNIKLTLMLMTFPLTYLVATFPIFAIISLKLIGHYFNFANQNKLQIPFAIAKIVMYINYSINILLFILFGKGLRKDFKALFYTKKVVRQKFNVSTRQI